jgi:hypothetical protein
MQLRNSDRFKSKDGSTPMLAEDMFRKDIIQVFSKKTGEYLGYIRQGQQLPEDTVDHEPEPDVININPAQLKMF